MKLSVNMLAIIALAIGPSALRAEDFLYDVYCEFGMSVPPGFERDQKQEKGDVIYFLKRPPSANQKIGTFIIVTDLKYQLDQGGVDSDELEAVPNATLLSEKWKEFEIDVIRSPRELDGKQMVTFNARVPLKPKAIMISVIGEKTGEEELRNVLRFVLEGLKGQTNWSTTREKLGQLKSLILKRVTVVSIVLFLVFLYWVRRTSTDGELQSKAEQKDNTQE